MFICYCIRVCNIAKRGCMSSVYFKNSKKRWLVEYTRRGKKMMKLYFSFYTKEEALNFIEFQGDAIEKDVLKGVDWKNRLKKKIHNEGRSYCSETGIVFYKIKKSEYQGFRERYKGYPELIKDVLHDN